MQHYHRNPNPLLQQRNMMMQRQNVNTTPPPVVTTTESRHSHTAPAPNCGRRQHSSCCCGCFTFIKHWAGVVAFLWIFVSLAWLIILSSKIGESEKEAAERTVRYGLLARAELVRPAGAGDGTALSSGWLQIDLGSCRVCYNLLFANYSSPATDIALHGPLDEFEPEITDVFLQLPFPNVTLSDGRLSACAAHVDVFFLESIINDPSAYYLVIRSETFPVEATRSYLKGVWPQA